MEFLVESEGLLQNILPKGNTMNPLRLENVLKSTISDGSTLQLTINTATFAMSGENYAYFNWLLKKPD